MHTLITPLGLSYGSLYSGILLVRPDHVIVLTSEQAAANIPRVVEAARKEHPDFTIEVHALADPFVGFAEGRRLAQEIAQRLKANGEPQITVCLTGGTTALQDAVMSIAQSLGAREIALVDRRGVEEQRQQPFAVGELVEIPPRTNRDTLHDGA